MLYQPMPIYDLRIFLASGLFDALTSAAADFIAADLKPWTYYLGVGVGGAVAATGIPGAAATAYVLADRIDFYLLHSPDGSIVEAYKDGLLTAAIDTFDPTPTWVKHTINFGQAIKTRVDLINAQLSPSNTSGIQWMAISQSETTNGIALQRGQSTMANFITSFSVLDADGDRGSIPIYVPRAALTLAQMTTFAQSLAPLIDVVIDGQIQEISLEVGIDLPAGLKATPVALSERQKGALFSFNAASTIYKHSTYIPTFKPTLFAGDSVLTANADVVAFVNAIVAGLSSVNPSDKFSNDLTALVAATKRFRS